MAFLISWEFSFLDSTSDEFCSLIPLLSMNFANFSTVLLLGPGFDLTRLGDWDSIVDKFWSSEFLATFLLLMLGFDFGTFSELSWVLDKFWPLSDFLVTILLLRAGFDFETLLFTLGKLFWGEVPCSVLEKFSPPSELCTFLLFELSLDFETSFSKLGVLWSSLVFLVKILSIFDLSLVKFCLSLEFSTFLLFGPSLDFEAPFSKVGFFWSSFIFLATILSIFDFPLVLLSGTGFDLEIFFSKSETFSWETKVSVCDTFLAPIFVFWLFSTILLLGRSFSLEILLLSDEKFDSFLEEFWFNFAFLVSWPSSFSSKPCLILDFGSFFERTFWLLFVAFCSFLATNLSKVTIFTGIFFSNFGDLVSLTKANSSESKAFSALFILGERFLLFLTNFSTISSLFKTTLASSTCNFLFLISFDEFVSSFAPFLRFLEFFPSFSLLGPMFLDFSFGEEFLSISWEWTLFTCISKTMPLWPRKSQKAQTLLKIVFFMILC